MLNQSQGATLLVVDDEPTILRLVDTVLTSSGFRVIPALGADTAIQAYQRLEDPPDLLLTDVVMPGMSGPMLADTLLKKQPSLRVLFMSGFDDRQLVQRHVVERGHNLIAKPFNLEVLIAKVREALSTDPEQPFTD